MKKSHLAVALVLLFIVSSLALFYIYTFKKSEKIEKNIREVKNFDATESGGAFSAFGVNLFGGEVNEIISGTQEATKGADFEQKINTLREIYNLPAAAVDFLFDGKIIFTDRANGYSFVKEHPDAKNLRLNQNALPAVYDASYGAGYILRALLDDDFNIRFNLEKANHNKESVVLDGVMINCSLFKGALLCVKNASNEYQIVKINFEEEGPKEEVLYISSFKHWNIDYKNDILFLTQKPSAKTESATLLVKKGESAKIVVKGVGLTSKVSPDAKKLLYSVFEDGELTLRVKDVQSLESKKLPFASFAQKCAFLENDIICAVPQNLDDFENPLDDWLKGKISFQDEFFIYRKDGTYEKIKFQSAKLPENFDVYKVKAHGKSRLVGFINKFNSKAWVLALAKKDEKESGTKNDETERNDEEIELKLKKDEI